MVDKRLWQLGSYTQAAKGAANEYKQLHGENPCLVRWMTVAEVLLDTSVWHGGIIAQGIWAEGGAEGSNLRLKPKL